MCGVVSEPGTKLEAAAWGQAGMLYDGLTPPGDGMGVRVPSSEGVSLRLSPLSPHVLAAKGKKRIW